MPRTPSKVVIPNVNETARPASLDRLASDLAPWAWPRQISYRQLNLLFTFTYLFVSHDQPDEDRQRTDKQTIYCLGAGSTNYYWCPPPLHELLGRASLDRLVCSLAASVSTKQMRLHLLIYL